MKTSRKNSKKRSQKLKKRAKRLAAYSAAAAVTVMASDQLADAAEVVHDITDINIFSGDSGRWFNMGNDVDGATSAVAYAFFQPTLGKFRLSAGFGGYIYGPTYYSVTDPNDPNSPIVPTILGFAGGNSFYTMPNDPNGDFGDLRPEAWASAYSPSSAINASDDFRDPGTGTYRSHFAYLGGSSGSTFNAGEMANGHGVIGIRFGLPDPADPNNSDANLTHYGWAQIYKYNSQAFVLTGFGYNDDPNATSTHPSDTFKLISDLNDNGISDPNDWDIFKAAWGVDDGGDMNGIDGTNIVDYQLFVQSYNLELGVGAFEAMIAAVPEPTSIMLLAAGAVGFGAWRKRKAV
jgi:hypothetical protein